MREIKLSVVVISDLLSDIDDSYYINVSPFGDKATLVTLWIQLEPVQPGYFRLYQEYRVSA